MKKALCAAMFLFVFSVAPASGADDAFTCKVTALFPSQGSLGEAVTRALRQTQSNISLALYGFNNRALAEELVKLTQRGVAVKVKIDAAKSNEKKESIIISFLKAAGVRVEAVAPEGRNHNKFAVIDQSKVITGSYNWTMKAENNWENLLILDCPELAKMYVKEWEKIK